MTTRVGFGGGGLTVATLVLSTGAAMGLVAGVPKVITWDTLTVNDPTNTWNVVLPSSTVTATKPGTVIINAKAGIATAAGLTEVDLENLVNGAGLDENSYPAGAGFNLRLPVNDVWVLNAGDTISTEVTAVGANTTMFSAIVQLALLSG